MTVLHILSSKSFKKVMDAEVALVDFNAPWCAPCHTQEPILTNVSEKVSGRAVVAAVNIDNHPSIALTYEIRNIPTLIVFKKGKEVVRLVGLQNVATLVTAVNKVVGQGRNHAS